MNKPFKTLPALTALLAALALAGCHKQPTTNDSQAARDTAAASEAVVTPRDTSTDQKLADAQQKARNAGEDLKQAGQKASDGLKQAGNQISDKVSDAVITTAVNEQLAKDNSLSALKINVDTAAGHVALRGTAPDAASRERATQLAQGVKGVVSVDNQLTASKS